MNRLVLEGKASDYGPADDSRRWDSLFEIGPFIGEVCVASAVNNKFGYGARPAKVILMVEAEEHLDAEGELSSYGGFGGTDVTPGEPAEVHIGDIDLVKKLEDLDGRTVALTVEGP